MCRLGTAFRGESGQLCHNGHRFTPGHTGRTPVAIVRPWQPESTDSWRRTPSNGRDHQTSVTAERGTTDELPGPSVDGHQALRYPP